MQKKLFAVVLRYKGLLIGVVAFALVMVFVPSLHSTGVATPSSPNGVGFIPYKPPGEGLAGTTVGGYVCTHGRRQVPWSLYAPYCVPQWHGNNGGATDKADPLAVTAKTINVSVNYASNQGLCSILASMESGSIASEALFKRMTNIYVSLFNKDFELWGRKVVIKYFNGQGCYANELLGQDQTEAEADAQTAASLHAFADMSELYSAPPYDTALAQYHIIAIGGEFMPHSWFAQNAPYEYSTIASCSKFMQSVVEIVKNSIYGLPAIYAAGKHLHGSPAKIGLIYPNAAFLRPCAQEVTGALKAAHIPVAAQFVYSITNFSSVESESTAVMADFRNKGVTTVICGCDPVTPAFMATAAAQQNYYPEWVPMTLGDGITRGIMGSPADKAEWAHAITAFVQTTPPQDQEYALAYKLATGHQLHGLVNVVTAGAAYGSVLLLFSALQQAGPDLTPQSFQRGMWSLPPSVQDASMGGWAFLPGHYTTPSNFQITYWNNSARGAVTHGVGAFVACNHGVFYTYAGYNEGPSLPVGKQLECFGSGGSSAPWVPPPSAIPKP
ncbi:MAG: ABC transporter substrate-binding protein [Actinobacteria bacterium]|nr:ABC transporter substrate-binding protein [Actinomycetota bacterium]MCL5446496.1 ABC transporter substrate-binding protein [Actinomycetota bacterium]